MLGFVTLYIIVADKISAYLESLKDAMEEYRDSVDRFSDTPQVVVPAWDTVVYVITLCFVIPVTEEITFRGVIFGQSLRTMGIGNLKRAYLRRHARINSPYRICGRLRYHHCSMLSPDRQHSRTDPASQHIQYLRLGNSDIHVI